MCENRGIRVNVLEKPRPKGIQGVRPFKDDFAFTTFPTTRGIHIPVLVHDFTLLTPGAATVAYGAGCDVFTDAQRARRLSNDKVRTVLPRFLAGLKIKINKLFHVSMWFPISQITEMAVLHERLAPLTVPLRAIVRFRVAFLTIDQSRTFRASPDGSA